MGCWVAIRVRQGRGDLPARTRGVWHPLDDPYERWVDATVLPTLAAAAS